MAWRDTKLLIKREKYGVPKVSNKGSSLGNQHKNNKVRQNNLDSMICKKCSSWELTTQANKGKQKKIKETKGERIEEQNKREVEEPEKEPTPQTNGRFCLTTAPSLKNKHTTFLESKMYFS